MKRILSALILAVCVVANASAQSLTPAERDKAMA
jgi:hypothetical protein